MKCCQLWSIIRNHFFRAVYAAVLLCAAFGWWGILYPQLTLTPETYRVVYEEEAAASRTDKEAVAEGNSRTGGDAEAPEEWNFDSSVYEEILNADSSRIRFRSRLLTEISEYLKRLQEDK